MTHRITKVIIKFEDGDTDEWDNIPSEVKTIDDVIKAIEIGLGDDWASATILVESEDA